jgi:hypothetical protein
MIVMELDGSIIGHAEREFAGDVVPSEQLEPGSKIDSTDIAQRFQRGGLRCNLDNAGQMPLGMLVSERGRSPTGYMGCSSVG